MYWWPSYLLDLNPIEKLWVKWKKTIKSKDKNIRETQTKSHRNQRRNEALFWKLYLYREEKILQIHKKKLKEINHLIYLNYIKYYDNICFLFVDIFT